MPHVPTENTSLLQKSNPSKVNVLGTRIILILVAASTAATLGYDVGIMASAMPFLQESMTLTTVQKQIAMGSLNFVAAFGALLGGWVAQTYGRKRTVEVCSWLFLVGTIIMSAASQYVWLIVGRTTAGLGVGVSFVVAPVYLAEVASIHERGMLNTVFDVAINSGILFGYVVGYALPTLFAGLANDILWRSMLGLGVVLPISVLAGIVWLPESPRWLVLAQHPVMAAEVLQELGNSREDSLEAVSAMQKELQEQQEAHVFSSRIWLTMQLGFWQQVSGTEAVLYYTADFLQTLPMQRRLAANVGVGLCKLFPELIAMLQVDKIGRRPLFLASSCFMVISMGGLAVAFAVNTSPYLSVLLLCAVMASFSVGVGPFTFLLAAESLSLEERSWGMTVCASVNRCTSGVVALTAVSMSHLLTQSGLFLTYAILASGATVFYWFCVPETAGRSLEELAAEGRNSKTRELSV